MHPQKRIRARHFQQQRGGRVVEGHEVEAGRTGKGEVTASHARSSWFFSQRVMQPLDYQGKEKMKAEFTAVIEQAPEGGYWAICPEIPGANGQGETIEEAKDSLKEAIELILEDRREDIFRGLPEDAIRETVFIAS